MTEKHNPTPWSLSHSEEPNGDIFSTDGRMVCIDTNGFPLPANAALIVQAVNAHAGLVADKERLLSVCNCAANTLKILGANGEWSMQLLNVLNEAIEQAKPKGETDETESH